MTESQRSIKQIDDVISGLEKVMDDSKSVLRNLSNIVHASSAFILLSMLIPLSPYAFDFLSAFKAEIYIFSFAALIVAIVFFLLGTLIRSRIAKADQYLRKAKIDFIETAPFLERSIRAGREAEILKKKVSELDSRLSESLEGSHDFESEALRLKKATDELSKEVNEISPKIELNLEEITRNINLSRVEINGALNIVKKIRYIKI